MTTLQQAGGRRGTDGLAEDLARMRAHLGERCPPYERALALLPETLEGSPGRRVAEAWTDRWFHAWYDRPLLLLAALRADALIEGAGHPLAAAFGPAADPGAVSADALAAGLGEGRSRVFQALARRSVQTNETSRAVAWLWPAALAGASEGRRPVALVDVGASAGLNLVADALAAPWTFEDGSPVPVARGIRAAARLGLDAAPLDAGSEEDAAWLRACVWPGEQARLDRLEAAILAFRAARARLDSPVLEPVPAEGAGARLARLSRTAPGTLVIAYQTVMRDYLSPPERAEYEDGVRAWLAGEPPGLALRVELEGASEGNASADPAGIVAHVRAPGGRLETIPLARCAFHPVRLVRTPDGAGRLAALLAPQGRAGSGE